MLGPGIVLQHPFLLVEMLVRASIAAGVAAVAVYGVQPRDPRLRYAAWLAVLLLLPAMLPAWLAVPEITVPALSGFTAWVAERGSVALDAVTLEPIEPPGNSLPVRVPVPVAIWLAGASARSAWLLWGALRAGRLGRAAKAAPRSWRRDVPARIRVGVSDRVKVPVTLGMFRPRVLLPASAARWNAGRIRAAIAHEVEHVRRRDTTTAWIAEAVLAAFWFHPVAWLARKEMLHAAECAADDAAARALGSRRRYARELVDVAAAMVDRPRRALGEVHLTGTPLARRIDSLLGPPVRRGRVTTLVAGAFLVALVAAIGFLGSSLTPRRAAPAASPHSVSTTDGAR